MLVTLLSDRRTAIVKPGEPRDIHVEPRPNASRVRYRAEQGVVGRIDKCDGSWCQIEIGKREGYIRMADVWGVGAGEVYRLAFSNADYSNKSEAYRLPREHSRLRSGSATSCKTGGCHGAFFSE